MKRKRSLALFMSALMLMGLLVGIFPTVLADIEPNDSFTQAEVIVSGVPMTGKTSTSDPVDIYKFTPVLGQRISTKLECLNGEDVTGYLINPAQENVLTTDYISAGTNEVFEYTTDRDVTGDYYYKVEGGISNYSLTVTITDQDDAGSGMDVGNAMIDAYPVTAGSFSGWVADVDYYDWYKFEITTAQIFTVKMTTGITGTDDLYYYVYDPQKNSIHSSDYLNPGVSETFEFTTSLDTQGTYYLDVEGGNNDYDIVITITDQDDAGLGMDAADDLTAPTIAGVGVELDGWVADDDVADVYGFNLINGQRIIFTLKTGTMGTDDLWAYIYDPNKDSIGSTDYLNPDVSETFEWTTSYATVGLYYLKIEGGNNNYHFTFSIEDQDDANSGLDANDDLNTALPVDNGSFSGWIFDADTSDYYSIPVVNGQNLSLTLTNGHTTSEDIWASVYDTSKNNLLDTDYLNPDISETLTYTTSMETPGTYYFNIEGGDNDYNFDVQLTDQDDAGTGMDAYGDLTKATHVSEGTYSGWVADGDTADAYNFTVNAGNVFGMNISASGDSGALDVEVYDTSKTELTTLSVAIGTTGSYSLSMADVPSTNSLYYVKVLGDGQFYTLDLVLPTTPPDITPPEVTILTPIPGAAYRSAQVILTGTATDDGTIKKVEVSIDNSTYSDCIGQGAWTCNINISTGANKITVRATDAAGNIGYADISPIHLDATPPSIVISSITNGTKVKKSTLMISGTAADNVGLSKVVVTLNGQPVVVTGTGTWSTTNMTLTKGENTVVVSVTDSAGNTKTDTQIIVYKKAKKAQSPGFEIVLFMGAVAIAAMVLFARKDR